MKVAALAVMLCLTGCSQMSLEQYQKWPAGYECDQGGACWPKDLKIDPTVREVFYSPKEVNRLCQAAGRNNAEKYKTIYACALVELKIVVLPDKAPRCRTIEQLRKHEHGHVAGVTVHNMVEAVNGCEFN